MKAAPTAVPTPAKAKGKQQKGNAAKNSTAPAVAVPPADEYETDEIWDPSAGVLHVETAAKLKVDASAAVAAQTKNTAAPTSGSSATSSSPLRSGHAGAEYEASAEDFGGNWKAAPTRRRIKPAAATAEE